MAGNLPVVCVFGLKNVELFSAGPVPDFETRELDCRCYLTDETLGEILVRDRPHVIVTFGVMEEFSRLMAAPFDVRRRWLHFDDADDMNKVGMAAFGCFLEGCVSDRRDAPPLVSVFTGAYRTGERILRPFHSLLGQRYGEWEWVVLDDSDDDGQTFRMLEDLAEKDYRISVYRARHSGRIGDVKNRAAMLCRGDFLVELDHDDELTYDALGCVVEGFRQFPEGGFLYTDCAEVYEDGNLVRYGEGWGFGYGSYRNEMYRGRNLLVTNAANINPKTIRHIVAAPNHIRAWRRSTYLEIGGHCRDVHVADDYEIMVRTFLKTRMIRVPRLGYIQYMNATGNVQRQRNQEIQRLVRMFRQAYDRKIHERFLELGVDDFVWDDENGRSDLEVENPEIESHCTLTVCFPEQETETTEKEK